MKTILVAEDEETIRNCLCLMLSRLMPDCLVLDASDGAEAVEILRRRPVDLLVTDLNMPELDGFGVIEQARQELPAILVYVMTGYCEFEDRERLRLLGMSRYFEKPFSFGTMAEIALADLGLARRSRERRTLQPGVVSCLAQ